MALNFHDPAIWEALIQTDAEHEQRRRRAMMQRPEPVSPKWARKLDPEMFTGTTRQIIERARAQEVAPDPADEAMLAEAEKVGPAPASRLSPEVTTKRVTPSREEIMPDQVATTRTEPAIPQQPQEEENLRRLFEPHVRGNGGSYIDMMRAYGQTRRGGPVTAPNQSTQFIPPARMAQASQPPAGTTTQPAVPQGGGGMFGMPGGNQGRYLLGGIGALMREMGGSRGALDAHMQQYQDIIETNKTRQAAVALGIPEEIAAVAPMQVLSPLMLESYKRKIGGQEPLKLGPDDILFDPATREVIYQGPGKPKDPNLVTLTSPDLGQSQTLDVSTPEGAQAMRAMLGASWIDASSLKKETMSELSRMMRERDNLRAQDPNHPDLRIYDARIQRMAEGSGMMMTVGPDGSITFAQGDPKALQQAGQYGAQSARDEALANVEFGKQTIGTLDKMLSAIDEDPTRVGMVGSVRRGLQTGAGIASDIGRAFPFTAPLMDYGRKLAEETIADEQVDEEFARELGGDFFDPTLSEISLFENTLAITLAKLRQERGRLLKDIYTDAKKDVKITGLTSAYDVQQKLKAVRQLLETHIAKQQQLIGIGDGKRRRYNPETGQLE